MATCYRHPDRETGLSCSECGRPVCTDCVTFAPVGLRCPDHATAAGPARAPQHVARTVRRARVQVTDAIVTRVLVVLNVLVYLIGVAQGSGISSPGGWLYTHGWLYGPQVADGDWWRLVTSAFLHANLWHIGLNMLALWWLGGPVEMAIGHIRYILLYFVSGLAGAAGALLLDPTAVTVGASGAIFGMLGAGLILEWQATGSPMGSYLTLIVINLAISFSVPNISLGGHLGGLIGGIIGTLVLSRFGRGHAAYGRLGVAGVAGLVAIAVASVLISYLKVRGLA